MGGYALLPVNYKLNSASNYAIRIKSYRSLSKDDKFKVASQISTSSKSYLKSTIVKGKKGYEFKTRTDKITTALNEIVEAGLKAIKPSYGVDKNSFSSIVEVMIKNLDGIQYRNLLADSADANYATALVEC